MSRRDNNNKKKRICRILDFAVPTDHIMKIRESEKRKKFLHIAGEQKKKQTMEHVGGGDASCKLCTRNNPQRIGKGIGRFGNKRTGRDHLDYIIIKTG